MTAWDRLMEAGIALAQELQQLSDEIRESCGDSAGADRIDALLSEWDAASSEMMAADVEGLAQMVLEHVPALEMAGWWHIARASARQILGQAPE